MDRLPDALEKRRERVFEARAVRGAAVSQQGAVSERQRRQ